MTLTTSATGPPRPDADPSGGAREMRQRREATALAIPAIRRAVRRWVVEVGLDEDTAESVLLAVDEAVTNAVEHAFPTGPGTVWVLLRRLPDGEVMVVVADDGVWRPVPEEPGYRGRGLQLVHALADHAEITGTARGTTVGMTWGSTPSSPSG